ncbi:hypothetical protein GGS23DRAFT_555142 [Durotheca rogersii]|uniref:uncharacterized protein n=1 Tax=Durotheca rogersii TaxID=419775 RepID=UPI0022207BEE|nr:uncharacterized protein GGS23DRAFT_555142 [Durotheca rogersii]KAI5866034.1 hypothetical protein GGS23DRAFT_555142 [Durotheca rogersii]
MQTYQNCPEAVTELQSCVCTKNNNFASIASQISSSVRYSCGATASEDQSSAATVYNAYCNQDAITPFPTPTNPVTQYITDFSQYHDLAPCAASGLSYAVQSMTYSLCPNEPRLLASCVCKKNQNSLLASQRINTSVRSSCSSQTADIESAQALLAGYCGLVDGTSSFPRTSNPPGDMTYFITALPEYSSLAPCARTAVSYGILSQTRKLCPAGPQALASCACIKNGMPGVLSNDVTSNVKYYCDSTATEDISSALQVFSLYCSAARGSITPAGVTDSVAQTSATGGGGDLGPTRTGASESTGSARVPGVPGGLGDSGSLDQSGESNSGTSSTNSGANSNTGTIVGAVVGVVGGLIVVGLAVFIFRRRAQHNKNPNVASAAGPEVGGGKPELDGSGFVPAPGPTSPSPSTLEAHAATRMDNVSPVSAHSSPPKSELPSQGAFPPSPIGLQPSELHNQNMYSQTQELQAQSANPSQMRGPHSPYGGQEALGQPIYEAPGQQQPPTYEAYGQPRSELQGMSWQSGPVTQYHEMDGGPRAH